MGGSIGLGMPLATGAAVACPDRKVVCLEGDGSGMYTVQALWTQAREGLDVTTVVFANRTYAILRGELASVGAGTPGRKATDMLDIGRPDLDWVALARGMGVPASRATTADEFNVSSPRACSRGPLSSRRCCEVRLSRPCPRCLPRQHPAGCPARSRSGREPRQGCGPREGTDPARACRAPRPRR